MRRRFAALAVLGTTLVLPQSAEAQSAMCAEAAVDRLTARVAPPSEAPSPMRDEDLPWCAGAEDPRCAPLHGDSTSIRIALRHPLAAAAALAPQRPSGSDDAKLTPDAGLAPRTGISNRVERPPRPIG